MHRPNRRNWLGAALWAVLPPAWAQARPTRIVVGFAPGGASDEVTRAFAAALQAGQGTPVIVEPRPGADGVIAAQSVAVAEPDGTALLLGSNTALIAVPALRVPPPYDPFVAFTPVCGLGHFTMSLLVNASLPVRSNVELLRWIERRPGELAAASSNSTAELCIVQLVGWRQVLRVPYRGDAPALLDLVAGRVQLMVATGSAAEPYVADGRLRRLATTAAGGGLSLDVLPWLGLFGPARLPMSQCVEIANRIEAGTRNAGLRARLARQNFMPAPMAPAEFDRFYRVQYARFVAAARRSGMSLER